MKRCDRLAFLYSGLATVALCSLVACGEDDFSDEKYGAIDLTPFYADGATAANPRAAVPAEIRTRRGWAEGSRVDYYDFGLVNHRRKRNLTTGATLREPDIAFVNPIYFLFDERGNPLHSKPIYDWRTGAFYMKGGLDLLNPNPREAPQNDGEKARYYSVPYSTRVRDTVKDGDRGGSDDYQRPIIDKLLNDGTYTGLWEVVHVKARGAYTPDAIKSWNTLSEAIDAGKFELKRTLSVINCPVVEEGTWVVPTSMSFRQPKKKRDANGVLLPEQGANADKAFIVPQVRMEVWYRTKIGFCHLANGYETLAVDDGDPRDPGQIQLKKFGEVGIDTFDVVRYPVGDDRTGKVDIVEVPVGKIYTPKVTIPSMAPGRANTDVFYGNDDLSAAMPRHFDSDPPGYSPIVWQWDVSVPQDPPYVFGSFKKLSDIDTPKLSARDNSTTVWTRNYPIVGVASPCSTNADCGSFEHTCNNLPDVELATSDVPSGKNLADVMIEREGGARCDVKPVGYGEFCAPGVARCETHVTKEQETGTVLEKSAVAGPALASLHAGVGTAEATLNMRRTELATAMAGGDMAAIAAAQTAVATAEAALATAKLSSDRYKAFGYHTEFSGKGYMCQPNTNTGGYCYVRCDASAAAGTAPTGDRLKKMLTVPTPRGGTREQLATFGFDARCGGVDLMGYKCLPGSNRPNRQRVCMRECTTRDTDGFNSTLCSYGLNDGEMGVTQREWRFYPGQSPVDSLKGQTCNNLANVTACMWNPDFEPRNPDFMMPRQQ